jgi:hypothetical protein
MNALAKPAPPRLLTRERLTVLVACIFVALGSGTNYVRAIRVIS